MFQVCMDLVDSFSASYDKRLITRTPLWHIVWLCMSVSLSFEHVFPLIIPYFLRNEMRTAMCGLYNADTYGLFNFLMPGASFYSAIEASSWLVSIFNNLFLVVDQYGNFYF